MGCRDEVFGAERLRMIPGDAGRMVHGEVRIGGTVIMLRDAATGWPVVPAHVHVYVADVDPDLPARARHWRRGREGSRQQWGW
ncbi:VOC family protein [Myxococcus sp. NMCA1]|uniref:VOC family protein n=1 Tax=Myxococcus sp. NMCA1 TaxID=2996785 RepID=UPI002286C4AA|nr:hypothetical protein [Myxococcus sp. NMCA1]WAM23002.1 hypothetical protein OZ403_20730 [Myxococcus sp. NMCA1]